MLVKISELKQLNEFKNIDDSELERKLKAIEEKIRSHTHNKFQNRMIRFEGSSVDRIINGACPYLRVGDTIEISKSVNNGLYTITSVSENTITVDRELFETELNLCTKIEYPKDIIDGAIELLKWEFDPDNGRSKVGIASESETLSRHSTSTTYRSYDKTNMIKGYPAELMSFCESYISMRY